MKILVTGSTSLLGAHTVQALVAAGHSVSTLQRTSAVQTVEGVQERLGSITDRDVVAAAVEGVDRIVHIAARVGIVGSADDFRSVNVDGTRNLIRAACRSDVGGMVFVSTPSVAHHGESLVGAAAGIADRLTCRGFYAQTKAEAELLALGASSATFPVVAIRPHLVIGPGDTQLVGRIVNRAKQGRLAVVGSGLALIDTVWVDNAAGALVAAMDRVQELAGNAYVVSNGEPRTVRELVERILKSANIDAPIRSVPTRAALVAGSVAERAFASLRPQDEPPITRFVAEQLSTAHWFDQRRTRADLGWEPRVSLDEGFQRLAEWFATESS